jgi:hypothetical protein
MTFKEISDKKLLDISLLWSLLEEAIDCRYVVFSGRNAVSDLSRSSFYLTEEGQIALEEYKRQLGADRKATWALIISVLSFLASVAAVVVACLVQ